MPTSIWAHLSKSKNNQLVILIMAGSNFFINPVQAATTVNYCIIYVFVLSAAMMHFVFPINMMDMMEKP
jgi:hypothetical protein